MIDLSIVIVSYNTADLLEACLRSLTRAQQPSKGMEIVVVDNNSKDGSVEMVRAKFPNVILIANDHNKGFAAANNQGVEGATGKHLLFLNSDTKVKPDAIVKPLKFLKTHPQVGAITVKLRLPDGNIDPDNHRGFPTPWVALTHFMGLSKLFPQSKIFNRYFQSYRNFNSIHAVELTAGSYLMMPAKLFKALNGWDEAYFFYGEDIDLCYRIHEAGYKIIYYPKVEVTHYKGASSGIRKEGAKVTTATKSTRIRIAKESVRAMEIFYKKFYAHKYPAVLTGFVLLGIRLKGWFRILKYSLT